MGSEWKSPQDSPQNTPTPSDTPEHPKTPSDTLSKFPCPPVFTTPKHSPDRLLGGQGSRSRPDRTTLGMLVVKWGSSMVSKGSQRVKGGSWRYWLVCPLKLPQILSSHKWDPWYFSVNLKVPRVSKIKMYQSYGSFGILGSLGRGFKAE